MLIAKGLNVTNISDNTYSSKTADIQYINGTYLYTTTNAFTGTASNMSYTTESNNSTTFWRYYYGFGPDLPYINSGSNYSHFGFWTDQAYSSGTLYVDQTYTMDQTGTYSLHLEGQYAGSRFTALRTIEMWINGGKVINYTQRSAADKKIDFTCSAGDTIRIKGSMETGGDFNLMSVRVRNSDGSGRSFSSSQDFYDPQIGWKLPIQKIIVAPGVDVQDMIISNNPNHGYIELNVEGDINGTDVIDDYVVTSTANPPVKITGNGNIGGRKTQRVGLNFTTPIRVNLIGGFGGASGPDFRYTPSYGNAFACQIDVPTGSYGTPVTATASNLRIRQAWNQRPYYGLYAWYPSINNTWSNAIYESVLWSDNGDTGDLDVDFVMTYTGTYTLSFAAYFEVGSGLSRIKVYINGNLVPPFTSLPSYASTPGSYWYSTAGFEAYGYGRGTRGASTKIQVQAGDRIRIIGEYPSVGWSGHYVRIYGDNAGTKTLTPFYPASVYTARWDYNEVDYANLGGGTQDINSTGIITDYVNSDGTLNVGTANRIKVYGLGANRRDERDLTLISGVISGQRYWWLCSNNKKNWGMTCDFSYTANSFQYYQPGFAGRELTATNANLFSSNAYTYLDGLDGVFEYDKFFGTIRGII